MDESLQELENELKRLTPRSPSATLVSALERELGSADVPALAPVRRYTSATSWSTWKWVSWSMAAAAAALVVALLLSRRPPEVVSENRLAETNPPASAVSSSVAATNRYEPVHASSVLYDLQEGDPTILPDRTEGREVRYRYVDTYTWKNPATNASVRWSVPRDEVRLVRASFD